jgi:hypothetical protein
MSTCAKCSEAHARAREAAVHGALLRATVVRNLRIADDLELPVNLVVQKVALLTRPTAAWTRMLLA